MVTDECLLLSMPLFFAIKFVASVYMLSGQELGYLVTFSVLMFPFLSVSLSTSYIPVLILFPFAVLRLKSPSTVFIGSECFSQWY